MGRNHFRVGAWLLAIFTCLVVAGNHSAYAWEHEQQPRVQAGGQYFTFAPTAPNGSAKVTFSITGRCRDGSSVCTTPTNVSYDDDNDRQSLGDYEYFNHFTGVRAHGRITSLKVGTASNACLAASATDTDPFGNPILSTSPFVGKPTAVVEGSGKDGNSFKMEVVDADDSSPRQTDTVCLVEVSGRTKLSPFGVMPEHDSNQPLIHGDIEVRNAPNTQNVY